MIRKATPKDFPCVIELYKAGLTETGANYSDSLVMAKVVNSFHLAPCFLLVKNDSIVGMAGLTFVTSSFSGDVILSDYMFYIEPEHRSLESLSSLVESAKQFADETKFPFRLEFIIHDDDALRRRLLKMHGFEPKAIVGIYNG